MYLEILITHSLVLQTSGFSLYSLIFFNFTFSLWQSVRGQDTSGWLWEGQPGVSSPHSGFGSGAVLSDAVPGGMCVLSSSLVGLCSSRTCRSYSGTLKCNFLEQSVESLWRKQARMQLREKHVAARAGVSCQVLQGPPVWGRKVKNQHQRDFQIYIGSTLSKSY